MNKTKQNKKITCLTNEVWFIRNSQNKKHNKKKVKIKLMKVFLSNFYKCKPLQVDFKVIYVCAIMYSKIILWKELFNNILLLYFIGHCNPLIRIATKLIIPISPWVAGRNVQQLDLNFKRPIWKAYYQSLCQKTSERKTPKK